jgi:hypothetical protein
MPLDQRIDDAGSLVFDSEPLSKAVTIVGSTVATLEIASDKPQAMICVRLSDVAPDGGATRVSYGVLNLSHRDGHASPVPLESGKRYKVRIALTEAAHVFATGRRIRISISNAYWPMVWPSPERTTLTVFSGESQVALPVLPEDRIRQHPDFPPVANATPLKRTILDPGAETRHVTYDVDADRTVVRNSRNDGRARIDDIGTTVAYRKVKEFAIARNDPSTAESTVSVSVHYSREDWDARLETSIQMTCDRDHFIFHSDVDAYESGARCFSRSFQHRVKRDNM